jgi:Amt family ammonium transporter
MAHLLIYLYLASLIFIPVVLLRKYEPAAAVAWMLMDWWQMKKPTALGTASGAIAGLATITPACGYVGPLAAIVIGVFAGLFCRFMVQWRTRNRIDDSLDAFGVHGMGGMAGAFMTGIFASYTATGLLHGGVKLMLAQLVAIAVVLVYSVVVSFVLLKILDRTMGLRVNHQEEFMGLDLALHGEAAYE